MHMFADSWGFGGDGVVLGWGEVGGGWSWVISTGALEGDRRRVVRDARSGGMEARQEEGTVEEEEWCGGGAAAAAAAKVSKG